MSALALAAASITFAGVRPPTSAVTLIKRKKVAAAFAKGLPMLKTGQFKIQAGRRDAPGVVEIHIRDTDIFHILVGSATLVTGGTATEQVAIAPGEIRGREIQGGKSHRISKGDVIVVPHGVPHWFKQTDGLLIYFVVKVTTN